MTYLDALDALSDHPHAWRHRQLCADDSDPGRRDAWRDRVIRMATGEPPDRPTVAESVELTRRMNACPRRSTEGCGCSGGRCAARGGAIVSHIDCFACLGRHP